LGEGSVALDATAVVKVYRRERLTPATGMKLERMIATPVASPRLAWPELWSKTPRAW